MLAKLVLLLCFLHVMVSAKGAGWRRIAFNRCIGPKNNHYKEFQYNGQSIFIIAMKMVHRRGTIGCASWGRSYWGCNSQYPQNIIVTDTKNKRIYPSPQKISLRTGGWYDLPGYGHYSPAIVFSESGFRYLYKGQKMRIWYGEDLYNYTEGDNHGFTCMDVYVYSAKI